MTTKVKEARDRLAKKRNVASKATANLVFRGNGHLSKDTKPPLHKKKGTSERKPDFGVVPSTPAAISLVDMSLVVSLVFGGCCTNVWTYEHLLNIDPRLGTTLTFTQMLFVTLISLPAFLTFKFFYGIPIPVLKERQAPLYHWILQVFVYTSGSLLNNWAFAFHVPLTVQIVFRSAGLAVSMLFGFMFLNRKYTLAQIASVTLVSAGVVTATISRPAASSNDPHPETVEQYVLGVIMLSISLLLTGILGMLQERTYAKFGPCWREGVFYTHFLSLPIFSFMIPHIKYGFTTLSKTTQSSTPSSLDSSLASFEFAKYTPYFMLAGNLATQLICVSGVNQLTSRVSSVSTNLVLTTRKAVSLCFSVWWFGNAWDMNLGLGAAMVFFGSFIYTAVSSGGPSTRSKADDKVKAE